MTRRVPIFATIIVLVAVATMIALGVWQLGRRAEKEALIARYEAALADPAPATDLNKEMLIDYADPYSQIAVDCHSGGLSTVRAGRNAAGQSGWAHQFACLYRGPSGKVAQVEVTGGWSRQPVPVTWNGGRVAGIVQPENLKELWNWHIVSTTPIAGLAANAAPDPGDLPNNHLAYAGQWFFFALTALVIYVLALRRKRRVSDLP